MPKTPMKYIRNRKELIESEITLTGLWNNEDVSNTIFFGSGRGSTYTNIRRSVKSPKNPRLREKVKVKDTKLHHITLAALWPSKTKVDVNPADTGDPKTATLDNRSDQKTPSDEDWLSRIQLEGTIRQYIQCLEDKTSFSLFSDLILVHSHVHHI